MKVAALQETKWFGNTVYRVRDCVGLASGPPAPQKDESRQRGEGVAILLLGSARIVTTRIKWNCGKRHIHIVSCYAPTYAASREDKNKFYDDLQLVLDKIPSEEPYILIGDLNARVGARRPVGQCTWPPQHE